MNQATKVDFEFVDGKELAIDAVYSHSVWKFHHRWLSFDGMHQDTVCEQDIPVKDDRFCCDHAVLGLWGQMLPQLVATDASAPSTAETLLKMSTRIARMPRGVKCVRNEKRGELVVSWDSGDSHQNSQKPVRVVLHSFDCLKEPKSLKEHPFNLIFNPGEGGK
jgi:hypothetical protein